MEPNIYLQIMDLLMQTKNPNATVAELETLWAQIHSLIPVATLLELRRIANTLEKLNDTVKRRPTR